MTESTDNWKAHRYFTQPTDESPRDQPTAFRTPGFPALLALIYLVVGENPIAARYVLICITNLSVPILYLLAMAVFSRLSIALCAGVLWMLSPTRLAMSAMLYGEETAALLLVSAVFLVVCSRNRQSKCLAAIAGLLLGAAILTRGYLLFVAVGPVVWLTVARARVLAAVFVVGLFIPTGSWVFRNVMVLGNPTLSTQTQELVWQGNSQWARGAWIGGYIKPARIHLLQRYPTIDKLDESHYARTLGHDCLHEIAEHPGRICWLLPRKAYVFLTPDSYIAFDWLYLMLLPFMGAGALFLWRLPLRSLLWLLGYPTVAVLVVCLITFGDTRFRHPIEPLLTLMAAFGVLQLFVMVTRFVQARDN